MENTRKNKIKFLAQYWGQYGFEKYHVGRDEGRLVNINEYSINRIEYVELKPLSKITKEDAEELMRLKLQVGEYKDDDITDLDITIDTSKHPENFNKVVINAVVSFKKWADIADGIFIGESNTLPSYQADFLVDKGYAVDKNGVSVETQIEWGWMKLKEK